MNYLLVFPSQVTIIQAALTNVFYAAVFIYSFPLVTVFFFFLIYLRAFSLTYKTAQLTLYSLGRGPPEPLFREQSVC